MPCLYGKLGSVVSYGYILEIVSNQSTVPMKIDRRQQHDKTLALGLLKTADQCVYTRRTRAGLQVQYL